MKNCILTAFALLDQDPQKRIGAIADYVSSLSPDLDRDDVLLAFHVREASPQIDANTIGEQISTLTILSNKIHWLDMISMNDRVLTPEEHVSLAELHRLATASVAALGAKIDFPDPRSGAGFGLVLSNGARNELGGTWQITGAKWGSYELDQEKKEAERERKLAKRRR